MCDARTSSRQQIQDYNPLHIATNGNNSAKNLALAAATLKRAPRKLSVRQLNAIELLVVGLSDAAVGRSIGAHRVTVTKWRLYNRRFKLALLRRREDVWDGAGDRLRSRLRDAVELLEQHLRSPDPLTSMRAAKALLTMAEVGKVVAADALERP